MEQRRIKVAAFMQSGISGMGMSFTVIITVILVAREVKWLLEAFYFVLKHLLVFAVPMFGAEIPIPSRHK